MKKQILLGLISLLSLVSCNNDTTTTTTENTLTDELETLSKAVESLKTDVDIKIQFNLGTEYKNPWYAAEYNANKTYEYNGSFRTYNKSNYINAKATLSLVENNITQSPFQTNTGCYNLQTQTVVNEYLNYKNIVQHKEDINMSTAGNHSAKDELYYNYFADININELTYDETLSNSAEKVYIYEGEALRDFAEDYASHRSKGIAYLTLQNDKFSKVVITYDNLETYFTNASSGVGEYFTSSLSATGTFTYSTENNLALQPIQTNKISVLDTLFNKFRNNYTVKYINSEYDDGKEAFRILYDDDKIAFDLYDMFSASETPLFGTLSWLDSVIRLDDEKSKYYIDNYAVDEDSGEFYWISNQELIEEVATNKDVDESLLYFEEGYFNQDISSIDSSLFTYDSETDMYNLSQDAVLYFGEVIYPKLINYVSFALYMVMFSSYMAYYGTSWKLKIIDENTFRIYGTFARSDKNGSVSLNSSWSFIFTNPSTTDTTAFYTTEA